LMKMLREKVSLRIVLAQENSTYLWAKSKMNSHWAADNVLILRIQICKRSFLNTSNRSSLFLKKVSICSKLIKSSKRPQKRDLTTLERSLRGSKLSSPPNMLR
jgi:hypothetical protein